MKDYLIISLIVSLTFSIMFIMTGVSAASCTPSSDYDYCTINIVIILLRAWRVAHEAWRLQVLRHAYCSVHYANNRDRLEV